MKSTRASLRAFTLIELLVVIAIVGLLASIVLAALSGARDGARLAGARQFASTVDNVVGSQAVGWWDFSECTGIAGASTVDKSGYGNTGILSSVGTPTWSTDTPNGAGCSLSFNGTNGNVDMGNASSLNFGTSNFTYSFWVKTTDNSNYKGIVSKGASTAADAGFKATTVSGGTALRVDISNGTASIIAGLQSTASVVDGKWHYIAVVCNRTGSATIYFDGVANASQAFSDAGSPTSVSGSATLKVGSENGSRFLNGLVDGVRLFSSVLTADQVGALYAEGLSSHPPVASLTE